MSNLKLLNYNMVHIWVKMILLGMKTGTEELRIKYEVCSMVFEDFNKINF